MFIAALFIIAKTWKLPKCSSTDEWIKKMWFVCVCVCACVYVCVYTHINTVEYYPVIEKEIMPFAAM